MDVFSQTMAVLPSISAMIYAELTLCPNASTMFGQAYQRETFFKALFTDSHARYHKEIRLQGLTCDEALEQSNPAALELRINHYYKVFRHHGFDRKLIEKIIDSMSPSSEKEPAKFDAGSIGVASFFNPEPYVPDGTEEGNEIDDAEASHHHAAHERMYIGPEDQQALLKSINPSGWVALMRKLNFEISPEGIHHEHVPGQPSFIINHKGTKVPVYIIAAARNAYDDRNTAAMAAKFFIESKLVMKGIEGALLFYGSPSVISDDTSISEGLVFWGEVYFDGMWGEMILHQKTNSFDRITADSEVVSQGLGTFDKSLFRDEGLSLMNYWFEHHNFVA
jgi:hypothetical protein